MNGAECRRERKKSDDLVESRMDAGDFERSVGLLLSQRAVYAYGIPLVGLERELDQLVPMYCRFRGFLSI